MKAILGRAAALYLFCASTSAFAGGFSVGYNEAWFVYNYPTWLASNPYYFTDRFCPKPPCNFLSTFDLTLRVIDSYFATMAPPNGNAKIVRLWLFPALQGIRLNYPSNHAPQTQGLTPEFCGNLKTVLAKNHGLTVYLTALNGNDMAAAVGTPLQAYFVNLLNNSAERLAFKNNVLDPLLNCLNQFNAIYPNVIYGLDLINEIEAPLNSNYFPTSWVGARNFIQDMATFVKSYPCAYCITGTTGSWLKVTSSAGYGNAVLEITLGLFSGIGLNFYDVHVYADWGLYPGVTWLCNRVSADHVPVILGEYGQKSQIVDDNLQYWTTANFLYGAKTHCISAALAWKYEDPIQPWFAYFTIADPINNPKGGTIRPAYDLIKYYGTLN
jgi:hypothetical protein